MEQDRTQLDQPQGCLAAGDDGVHAGAIRVVGTDTTVAIAIEGSGIAAGPAVPFASNEIHELGFLGLLHGSLSLVLRLSVERDGSGRGRREELWAMAVTRRRSLG